MENVMDKFSGISSENSDENINKINSNEKEIECIYC